MSKHVYNSAGYDETTAIAAEFAKELKGGELILLEGDLGAGKTAFCSGMFSGLDCEGSCSSPTFSIVNIYEGRLRFAHLDLYRITERELEQTGIYELLDGGAVVAVEWASNAPVLLDEADYTVDINTTGEQTREIIITDIKR